MVDYREILRLQSLGNNITQIAGSLRSDILENLGHRHYGSPAYQLFKELQYNGGDPMEFRDYLVKVQKPVKANGHVGTNLSLKRRPFWGMLKSFSRRHSRR